MTQYTIFVQFVKVVIFKKLDKWEFIATNGGELMARGGNFETHEVAKHRATALINQIIEHEKENSGHSALQKVVL